MPSTLRPPISALVLLLALLALPRTACPAEAPTVTNSQPPSPPSGLRIVHSSVDSLSTTNPQSAIRTPQSTIDSAPRTSVQRSKLDVESSMLSASNPAPSSAAQPSALNPQPTSAPPADSALRLLRSTLDSLSTTNPLPAPGSLLPAPGSLLPAPGSLPSATNPQPILATNLAASMEALDDKHRLGVGDRLSFRIVEDQEDPKPIIVTDSGELELPYLGRFPALDKTCRQLANEIKAKLEEDYYYQATVILAVDQLNKSRGKVYLVGYVRMPGPQDIPSDEVFTLSKAIMRAGGFSDFADKKKVRVTRKGPTGDGTTQTAEIDVSSILEHGRQERDIKLEVGDLIYVPSRLFKF